MDTEAKWVIVTGARGWIGRHVCAWLQRGGKKVLACDIVQEDGPWDRFVKLDIAEPFGTPSKAKLSLSNTNPDCIIHCAGHAHRPIETTEEIKRFFQINAKGTQSVLELAGLIGVSKFLYVSSIAFYDWDGSAIGEPLTERAPAYGATAYAQSKLQGEQAVRESSSDYRIVRLATVFGNGDRANFSKLAQALKRKRFILPGEGSARKSVISVEKAAEWIARYALMDSPKYRLINLGFPDAPSLAEICDGYSEVCGFKKPKNLPLPVLRTIAHIGDLIARVKPSFPLTSTNVHKLTQSTWVDCSKAVELFPDAVDQSFRKSLESCAEYYRNL